MTSKQLEKKFNSIKRWSFRDLMSLGVAEEQLLKDFDEQNIARTQVDDLNNFIQKWYNIAIAQSGEDYFLQSRIHFSQALFDYKYQDGASVNIFKEFSNEARLKLFHVQNSNDDTKCNVLIIPGPNACEECSKDPDKRYEIADLLKNNILPHKDCSCGGFGCSWSYLNRPAEDWDTFLENLVKEPMEKHRGQPESTREGARLILNVLKFFRKK